MGARTRQARSRFALLRALTAAATMGVTLAVVTWVAGLLDVAAGPAHPLGTRVAVAAPVCVVVVAVIVWLRRRWDRASLTSIGLTGTRADVSGFVLGMAVVLGCGALVLGLLSLFGAASWISIDPLALLLFLGTNALVALLLEAIPEEVAIRGFALTVLRERFASTAALLLTIVTFLAVPLIALVSGGLLAMASGDADAALVVAPGGQDPFSYYLMLAAFGLTLIYARDATRAATVWTCVGAHLAWLTVNRLVLGQTTALQVELGEIATLVFFAGYLTAAIIAFAWVGSRRPAEVQMASRL